MKKALLFTIILAALAAAPTASGRADNSAGSTFKVGGVPIAIPPPGVMVEVGYEGRELMEVIVPPTNRLVAAFLTSDDLPRLKAGSAGLTMERYAMVQVSRRGEYLDLGPSQFRELIDSMAKDLPRGFASTTGDVEAELNRRMRALDQEAQTMKLGEPTVLGTFLSKEDAFAFGSIMPVSVGGQTVKMLLAATFLRVKQRLLFSYNYTVFGGEESVRALRKSTEQWAEAILKANR